MLHLTEPAQAGRVVLGSPAQRWDILTRAYQPRGVRVAGSTVTMRIVRRPGALPDYNAATIANGTVRPKFLYRC